MLRREKGGLVYLEFEIFQEFKNLRHAIFLRHGGQSIGAYNSLNVSHDVGDDSNAVNANMSHIFKSLGVYKVYQALQVHGKRIIEVVPESKTIIPDCDSLMTNKVGIPLMIKHADCQVAIFYDPIHRAVANVHCGWKGSVANIYQVTVDAMEAKYKSNPADLLVGISPSLGPKAAQFINYKKELPEAFYEHMIQEPYFDFWAISRSQLMEAGILSNHIEIAGLCTYSCSEDYFSFRRANITGRHGTITLLA